MPTPDYFELYELPQGFRFDPAVLRKKYYSLSRDFHPDRFAQSGSEEYSEALRMSALNNEAFHTLGDLMRCMGYVLRLHGLLQQEETYSLPPEFLMEMMDLNEAVDEGGDSARAMHQDAICNWEEEASPLMTRFESGERGAQLMSELKEYYFQRKYLDRIGGRLKSH